VYTLKCTYLKNIHETSFSPLVLCKTCPLCLRQHKKSFHIQRLEFSDNFYLQHGSSKFFEVIFRDKTDENIFNLFFSATMSWWRATLQFMAHDLVYQQHGIHHASSARRVKSSSWI
jgi:hypothetical protein